MIEFDALLVLLADAEVEFVVVGGYAVMKAGYVRVTEDIDLLIEASEANVTRFLRAMQSFSPAAADLSPRDFPLEEGCIRFEEELDVDVFTLMSGRTFADLLPLSTAHDVQGRPVHFLGRDGLITLKSGSLRPKDQLDVAHLRRLPPQPRQT
jgi:hypothetical protein